MLSNLVSPHTGSCVRAKQIAQNPALIEKLKTSNSRCGGLLILSLSDMLYLYPNICSLMILCSVLEGDDGSRLWHAHGDGIQHAAHWLH